MCCTRLAENTGRKNDTKNRHLRIIAQLCRTMSTQVSTYRQSGKKLLNSYISFICCHNMANFGPLVAEIGSGVWGAAANLNRFLILASLVEHCHSPEANQTLHNVWPYPGLLHYTFSGSYPSEFRHMQNSLCIQILRSPILLALLHSTPAAGSARLCIGVQGKELRNFRRGRHLYSVGWPPRWASVHILVNNVVLTCWQCWSKLLHNFCRCFIALSAVRTSCVIYCRQIK